MAGAILPFPPEIDRDYFGAWLSGFVDGEGCFYLGQHCQHKAPVAALQILLRADDLAVLQKIQSYWNCGVLKYRPRPSERSSRPRSNPAWTYWAWSANYLQRIIVPHFIRFPLQAKKARDFEIWRQAVQLIFNAQQLGKRCMGKRYGFRRNWTPENLAHFQILYEALRSVRAYNSSDVPDLTPPPPSCPLFDHLP
ncbi:MAG TPA: LAGLIDADG family homing endonuclease [Gemmataceae bacterium]|nr:LAGLIDADG family homing endonuclease [Gemmataceae bacterium]